MKTIYYVWFPEKPSKTKTFRLYRRAMAFGKKQKIECYLNKEVDGESDTIVGFNSNETL